MCTSDPNKRQNLTCLCVFEGFLRIHESPVICQSDSLSSSGSPGGKARGISSVGGSHDRSRYRVACRQSTNWRTIIPKKLLHCCESSRPHHRLAHLGIQQREWESLRNLTLNVSVFCLFVCFYKTFTGLGKQSFGGHKQNLVYIRIQEKGAVTPQ